MLKFQAPGLTLAITKADATPAWHSENSESAAMRRLSRCPRTATSKVSSISAPGLKENNMASDSLSRCRINGTEDSCFRAGAG